MNTQKDTLTLKEKADATPQLLAQLKGDDKKDGCAGTFHTVGAYTLPCMGDGHVLRRYEQTTYSCTLTEHKNTIGALKDSLAEAVRLKEERELFGEENPEAMIETTVCRPLSVDVCPCKTAQHLDEYQENILKDLGIGRVRNLSKNQKAAHEAFKVHKKNLFITGPQLQGKTTLAAACAMEYQRGVRVLKADDLATELRSMAMNNQKPRYTGLLILDDLHRMTPTEAMREKLFLIFDAARGGKSFRLIVTSSKDSAALCEQFSLGDQRALKDLLVRFSTLQEVQLP